MSHSLHEHIGEFLRGWNYFHFDDNNRILFGPECGGTHDLPIYYPTSSNELVKFAKADIIVVMNGKVRCIIEIEESNTKPIHLIGKYSTAVMCDRYQYSFRHFKSTVPSEVYPFDSVVHFIQIVKNLDNFLKKGSGKIDQFNFVFEAIKEHGISGNASSFEYEGMVYESSNILCDEIMRTILEKACSE